MTKPKAYSPPPKVEAPTPAPFVPLNLKAHPHLRNSKPVFSPSVSAGRVPLHNYKS